MRHVRLTGSIVDSTVATVGTLWPGDPTMGFEELTGDEQATSVRGGEAVLLVAASAPMIRSHVRRLGALRYVAVILCMAPGPCCHQDVMKPSYRTVTSLPPGIKWSGPITLVADDQKFHIGNTSFLFRSGFTDQQFSNSAVRVPQQDLFGDSLLTLAAIDSTAVVAHLGDAMDVSCDDEWRVFSRIMAETNRPSWFWTPGNHDGYFFGNFVGPEGQWADACRPAKRMTKDMLLRDYVNHLASYSHGTLDPSKAAWSCAAADCRSLRQAAWHIEQGDTFYTSFVLQELDLPRSEGALPASLIMVDTSTYERAPRIAPSEPLFRYAAGEEGHVGPAQLRLVQEWTAKAAHEGRIVVLAGHHTFNDLDEVARAAIQELIDHKQAATYISAHTHWGQYFAHTGPNGDTWLEPNLGSIIDYDSEFGTLTVGAAGASRFVRMSRTTVGSILIGKRNADQGIACENPDWLARPTEPDFYTNYKTTTSPRPTTVDKLYFQTMLAALDRYWRCVPTTEAAIPLHETCLPSSTPCQPSSEVHDEVSRALASDDLDKLRKVTFSLLERDAKRNVDACVRREYKVCQSMWAAEYEKRDHITPVRDEDIFEVNVVRQAVRP